MLRGLALVAGLAALAVPGARAFPHAPGCVRVEAGGVPGLRCGPAQGARAAIVLHGCGGFSTFDHRLATGLPAYGISTLYLDYFAPTPPPGRRGFCSVWTRPRDLFAVWQRVVAQAAGELRAHYRHVAAVGWSLGAGVAISAAENGHPFDAVAAFSALAYPPVLDRAGRLPPTIFLDGGAHDIVPPSNTFALFRAARRAHVPAAEYVYGNGTHNWPGAQGSAGIAHAAAFLLRYLR